MGHSNHATARIQYLGQDTDGYIRIPRGLLEQLENKCREAGIAVDLQNKRSCGRPVRVSFRQELYLQQDLAAQRLLQFDDGILSAATAFGKTAVCSYLISSRKVSTLVLLRSKALMNQWLEVFSIFPWWIHYAGRKTFRICSKHMGWSLWTNVIMELLQVRRRY